jgi:flagellar export protein FliJ
MKSFTFSLEALLRIRAQQKEQALLVWAAACQDLRLNTEEIDRLQKELQVWHTLHREKHGDIITAGDFSRDQKSTEELFRRFLSHQRLQVRLQNRVNETLQVWNEARKKEEILERLKKRSFATWTREWEREEQKLQDDRSSILAFSNPARHQLAQPA